MDPRLGLRVHAGRSINERRDRGQEGEGEGEGADGTKDFIEEMLVGMGWSDELRETAKR